MQCLPDLSAVSTSCQHSRFHCGHAHGHVPLPGCGGDDHVEVLRFAHAFEIGFASGIARWLGLTGLRDPPLGPTDAIFTNVAQGPDLDAFQLQQDLQQARTSAADADEADLQRFLGPGLATGSVRLCGRTDCFRCAAQRQGGAAAPQKCSSAVGFVHRIVSVTDDSSLYDASLMIAQRAGRCYNAFS
jgi:hypothetical protein